MNYIPENEERNEWLADTRVARSYATFIPMFINDNFKPGKVLDIGTGSGLLVDELRKYGFYSIGIDMRNEFSHDFRRDNKYIIATAFKLPFKDSSFDIVTENLAISDIIEFQDKSIEECKSIFEEIHRVLKPSGIYVGRLSEQYNDFLFNKIPSKFDDLRNSKLYRRIDNPIAPKDYDTELIESVINNT